MKAPGSAMFLDVGPVSLRTLKPSDRENLIAVLMDAVTMRHALRDQSYTHDEADVFVSNNFAAADELLGMRCICLNATDQTIGFAGYRTCRYLDADDVEFGWVLARLHHGKGYATALGQRLIRHALQVLSMTRILAACNPANAASEHILRDKLQMQFEREVEVRPNFRRRVYVAGPEMGTRN
jgi:RimJ/RimL family protein N-acetyltransferase